MDILQPGKAIEDHLKLLAKRLLCKFDFTSVESCFKKSSVRTKGFPTIELCIHMNNPEAFRNGLGSGTHLVYD
jgi:hypothetical protein